MFHPDKLFKEDYSSSAEVQFSPSRGFIHGFNLSNETEPAYVIANGGAQLMNSRHYFNRHTSEESSELVRANQEATTGYMLAFSKPGDRFIFTSAQSDLTIATLERIRESYEQVGIGVAANFQSVEDIDDIDVGGSPVVYHILSPEVLMRNGHATTAEKNVMAYIKNITHEIWEQNGVPIPPTLFINGQSIDDWTRQLTMFSTFPELVINTVEGSGGYGLEFIDAQKAIDYVLTLKKQFSQETLQVQGSFHPLKASPCAIFNIGEGGVNLLIITEQKFTRPGVHAGNIWERGMEDRLANTYGSFNQVITSSVQALSGFGVRGQINNDVLILHQNQAEQHGLDQVLMRESNIRPAGSSVFLRLRDDADIDGQKPDKILTNTTVHIPPEVFFDTSLLVGMNQTPNMKTIIYNYYLKNSKAYLAFLGNDQVSISDLKKYEEDTLRCLHTWR